MNLLLASATEHAENGFIIPGDTNEVIWGTISFTIVVLLFLWKGLGPVKVMWHARIDRIRNEVTSAADTRAAAEAKLAEVESNIANAGAERQRILTEARETAASLKQQIIAKAGSDAADLRTRGASDVEAAKSQATSDLQSEIGLLAVGAAEAVVANNLDAATQAELIESYITRVGAGS